jgi:hypothetical protein
MTNWEVIRWWELRRVSYNAILFVIGIASIFAMELLMSKVIPIGEDAVEPIVLAFSVVAYGVLANLCYTLGWIVELVSKREHEVGARQRAEKLFLLGLWFSCLLTSAPLWFGLAFWITHRR